MNLSARTFADLRGGHLAGTGELSGGDAAPTGGSAPCQSTAKSPGH